MEEPSGGCCCSVGMAHAMLLSDAIIFATNAHAGQVDLNGDPYILHPLRVMLAVRPELRIPAVLHDTVEDTSVTLVKICEKYGAETESIVDSLSRRNGETYKEYITRLLKDEKAKEIKLADLEDNMDLSRTLNMDKPMSGLWKRYVETWHLIVTGK